MNAIMGMSELLSRTNLTREQRDYLNLVRESAELAAAIAERHSGFLKD